MDNEVICVIDGMAYLALACVISYRCLYRVSFTIDISAHRVLYRVFMPLIFKTNRSILSLLFNNFNTVTLAPVNLR